MEYIVFILSVVLIGLVMTITLRKRCPMVVWGFWLTFVIQMAHQAAFYSYRFGRMWVDIERFFL